MNAGVATTLAVLALVPSWAAAEPAAEPAAKPELRAETTGSGVGCELAVELSGDTQLLPGLEAELRKLGLGTEVQESCPAARVSIDEVSSGLFVSLTEVDGRTGYRNVSDLRIAATWIDSRLRDDLGASLLDARSITPRLGKTPPTVATAPSSPPSLAAKLPETRARSSRWFAGLRYESASAGAGQDWQALRGGLCAQLGPACVGVGLRVGRLQDDLFSEEGFSRFEQVAVDALVDARVPIRVGRGVLSPQIALGAGMVESTRRPSEECLFFTEDGSCEAFFLEEELSSRRSWAPRVEAGLDFALPISSRVTLQLGASMDLRPLGASDRSVEDPGLPEPLPEPPVCEPAEDPDCFDVEPEPFFVQTLPEDPLQFFRLSLGLQVRL